MVSACTLSKYGEEPVKSSGSTSSDSQSWGSVVILRSTKYIHPPIYSYAISLPKSSKKLFNRCLPYSALTSPPVTAWTPSSSNHKSEQPDQARGQVAPRGAGKARGAIDRWMYVFCRSEDHYWSSWSTINTYIHLSILMLDPHGTVREAWLRDPHRGQCMELTGMNRRQQSCTWEIQLRGGDIPKIKGDKRIRRPPIGCLLNLLDWDPGEQCPGCTDTPGVVSTGRNPRRQHRRASCSDSSHNPLRDDFSRSRRKGLPRDNEQLIARPLVLSTRPIVLQGPDWAPDLIFGHRRVSRERLDKNLDRLRRSSLDEAGVRYQTHPSTFPPNVTGGRG